MKKILVINTSYRIYGGEDSNILDEIALLKKKYEVEYLQFKNSDKIKLLELISFLTNQNKLSNRLLINKLNAFNPDVVYVHNTWFKGNLGIFKILEKQNIPVLHKIHNFRYFCTNSFFASSHFANVKICYKCGSEKKRFFIFNKYYKDSFSRSLLMIIYGKKYFKILLSNRMKLLIMNEFHKNFLVNLGIKEERIAIYYNPITIESKSYMEYNSKNNTVVYAGRLTKDKGLIELLKTWREANTKNLELLLLGSGDLEQELREKYVDKNIKFLGPVSNKEARRIIKNSRAVVTATRLLEGQPRLLSEASSYGIPSIFPSFGGMSEYFPENYELTFKQFDYTDLKRKIEKLNDIKLMEKLSKEVHLKAFETLSDHILVDSFENLINSNE